MIEAGANPPAALRRVSRIQPRTNPGYLPARIDFEDLVDVLAPIQHDGGIAALPRQAGACSARENGRAKFTRYPNRLHHVLRASGNHDSDRHLAIIGRIRRVSGPASRIEADLALNVGLQLILQPRTSTLFMGIRGGSEAELESRILKAFMGSSLCKRKGWLGIWRKTCRFRNAT